MRSYVMTLLFLVAAVPLAGTVGVAAEQTATPPGEVSARATKAELARRFYEEFHAGNVAVADEIIAPDAVFHMAGGDVDLDESKQTVAAIQAAFTDVEWPVEDTVVEGDKVAVRWTFRGTHVGEFGGIPPSGNRVEVSGISILRIENGRIVEGWIEFDSLSLLQQLGASPGATPAPAASSRSEMWPPTRLIHSATRGSS